MWRARHVATDVDVAVKVLALFTGRPPFRGPDTASTFALHRDAELPELVPRLPVPDGLERWLRALLAKREVTSA